MIDLYIDPGLRAAGAALFNDGKLIQAALLEGDPGGTMTHIQDRWPILREIAGAAARWKGGADRVFIELPQIYKRGRQRAQKAGTDPNDLIHLAAAVGALASALPAAFGTRLVLPAEWKGQMPKEIMHMRAVKLLADEEIAKLPKLAKSKFHNVMDAVCMGLVDHGRLKTAGVI